MKARRYRPTSEFPLLPGYMTIDEIATLFGITKTAVFDFIHEDRMFKTVYRVGVTSRPMLVVPTDDVMAVKEQRDASKAEKLGS